jgi:O-antigen ligase
MSSPVTTLRTSAIIRFATAFAMLGSVIWQISSRVANNVFRPWEYFSYFTIQTSLIAIVTLSVAGWFAWTGRTETRVLNIVRLCTVTFTVVVTLVYNLLLRGLPDAAADGDYVWPVLPNEILHVWAAIFMLIDWILSSRRINLRVRAIFWVLVFPLVWLVYSIIRGLIVDWWPYWFINPNEPAGIPGMLSYIVGIMLFLLTVAIGLIGLQRITVRAFRN